MQGHLTSSLQVKIVRFDWTEEEREHFLQVTKEKNVTILEQTNANTEQISANVLHVCLSFSKTVMEAQLITTQHTWHNKSDSSPRSEVRFSFSIGADR